MLSWIQSLDETIEFFIRANWHSTVLDSIMTVLTVLGNSGVFWIALGICLLFFKKTRKCGIFVLLSLLIQFAIGEGILKHVIARPRPYQLYPEYEPFVKPLTTTSFPSGHSMAAFAASTAIVQFNKKYGIAAYVLAALIAFSRVYLFMHWPSDILSGAIFGTIVGLLTVQIYRYYEKKKKQPEVVAEQ